MTYILCERLIFDYLLLEIMIRKSIACAVMPPARKYKQILLVFTELQFVIVFSWEVTSYSVLKFMKINCIPCSDSVCQQETW